MLWTLIVELMVPLWPQTDARSESTTMIMATTAWTTVAHHHRRLEPIAFVWYDNKSSPLMSISQRRWSRSLGFRVIWTQTCIQRVLCTCMYMICFCFCRSFTILLNERCVMRLVYDKYMFLYGDWTALHKVHNLFCGCPARWRWYGQGDLRWWHDYMWRGVEDICNLEKPFL